VPWQKTLSSQCRFVRRLLAAQWCERHAQFVELAVVPVR
jgi:hypothetical protein